MGDDVERLRSRLCDRASTTAAWRLRRAVRRLAARSDAGDLDARRVLLRVATTPDHAHAGAASAAVAAHRHEQATVGLLSDLWSENRSAEVEALLRAAPRPSYVRPEDVPLLLLLGDDRVHPATLVHAEDVVDALGDTDPRIRAAARTAIAASADHWAMQALARRWADTRDPVLGETLVAIGRLPVWWDEHHVLVALHLGAETDAGLADGDADPHPAESLVDAAEDCDATIRERAADRLRRLDDPWGQHWVCALAIEGRPAAGAAVREAGYLPRDPVDRAVCLLLTEQWERYQDLDHDARLLATAYAAAGPDRQERIRDAARASGRVDVVTLLLGADRRGAPSTLSPAESTYLVDALIERSRYEQVWRLALDLPLAVILAAAERLEGAGWRPSDPSAGRLCERLAAASAAGARVDALLAELPVAVPAGRFPLGGVQAFTPDGCCVSSIGGRIEVWDPATGESRWTQRFCRCGDSHHGQNHLAVVGPDRVAVALNHQSTEPFALYVVDPEGVRPLGSPDTWLIGLAAWGDDAVVGCTNRAQLISWRLDGSHRDVVDAVGAPVPWHAVRKELAWDHDPATTRSVGIGGFAAAPELGRVAVADSFSVRVVEPGTGRTVASAPARSERVPWAVAFAPCGNELLVLEKEGPTTAYRIRAPGLEPIDDVDDGYLWRCALATVPARSLVLTAGTVRGAGDAVRTVMRVHLRPHGPPLGTVDLDGEPERLVVSPSGDLVAVARAWDTTLWDLRPSAIHALVCRPLADAGPNDLATVAGLARRSLSAPARACAEAMAEVLRFRLRDHIAIEDAPDAHAPGRGDIDLSEV